VTYPSSSIIVRLKVVLASGWSDWWCLAYLAACARPDSILHAPFVVLAFQPLVLEPKFTDTKLGRAVLESLAKLVGSP
jgi:hypothetical protein